MLRPNFAVIIFLLIIMHLCIPTQIISNGDGSEPPQTIEVPLELSEKGWAYGFIEFEHDLDKANLFYMKLQGHPESKIPNINGGYSTTDVNVFVKIRGVDVGKALHHARQRHRPHVFQREERQRWADTMTYLWNLVDQTHTFKVHNMKMIGKTLDGDTYKNGIIEADLEVLLGGAWHNLALMMMQDEMARPIQSDGSEWDSGSREYSLLNPDIPK